MAINKANGIECTCDLYFLNTFYLKITLEFQLSSNLINLTITV